MKIERKNIILFREAVKHRRLELNMSQKELAKLVGYKSASAISRIEKGTLYPPFSRINDFAAALKTTLEKLICLEEMTGKLFEGEFIK